MQVGEGSHAGWWRNSEAGSGLLWKIETEEEERKKEGRRESPGISLGSGMILIYFASPVLNCSPLFLVSVWIPFDIWRPFV